MPVSRQLAVKSLAWKFSSFMISPWALSPEAQFSTADDSNQTLIFSFVVDCQKTVRFIQFSPTRARLSLQTFNFFYFENLFFSNHFNPKELPILSFRSIFSSIFTPLIWWNFCLFRFGNVQGRRDLFEKKMAGRPSIFSTTNLERYFSDETAIFGTTSTSCVASDSQKIIDVFSKKRLQ